MSEIPEGTTVAQLRALEEELTRRAAFTQATLSQVREQRQKMCTERIQKLLATFESKETGVGCISRGTPFVVGRPEPKVYVRLARDLFRDATDNDEDNPEVQAISLLDGELWTVRDSRRFDGWPITWPQALQVLAIQLGVEEG